MSITNQSAKKNIPTVIVILGATGDLMKKKIVPAIFHLYKSGLTPKMFRIVGVSRRNLNDNDFKKKLSGILDSHQEINYGDFLKNWTYKKIDFEDFSQYGILAEYLGPYDKTWRVCSNKLFYIAAPPEYYEKILNHLHDSNLTKPCSPEEGFTRLLIEKPFGKDTKTANRLEEILRRLFKEEQIYRVDHYLAKETLQNILNFRFSNSLFEGSWNNNYIEKVRIRLWETLGVEERGNFYDGIGALRDVGQNHLLQMLALITMDKPRAFSAGDIRTKRKEILKTLIRPDKDEIKKYSYRGQYRDYRKVRDVRKQSDTETYFKIRAFLNHPRWQGIPFILESGKKLAKVRKEIDVIFRHQTPCACPPGSPHLKNRVVFEIEPEEGVFVDLWSKKPGLNSDIQGQKFQYLIRKSGKKTQYVEEYEKLILDAIEGDQTLFVESSEVKETWRFIDPFIEGWKNNSVPLKNYRPDTLEAVWDSRYIDENDGKLTSIHKRIGIVGLGKMGANLATRLLEKGWNVAGYNRSREDTDKLKPNGLIPSYTLKNLVLSLPKPRLIWLCLPAGPEVGEIFAYLEAGDTVIDGGNSYYLDSKRRAEDLVKRKINFIDVGFSGGPSGARNGASLMIGGEEEVFKKNERLFYDPAAENSYKFFKGAGAGHFVKMIHNGIEYGMMQAIAEGFEILKKSSYSIDLEKAADIYNHGSVIESRLVGWLKKAFDIHGPELNKVPFKVSHTGEGKWTVDEAVRMNLKARIISESLKFRIGSGKTDSFTGRILSALREQFGGHKS